MDTGSIFKPIEKKLVDELKLSMQEASIARITYSNGSTETSTHRPMLQFQIEASNRSIEKQWLRICGGKSERGSDPGQVWLVATSTTLYTNARCHCVSSDIGF